MPTWRERAAREQRAAAEAAEAGPELASALPKAALTLAVLVWGATFLLAVFVLPDQVPTHWPGSSGSDGLVRADGWSSKPGALVFMALTFAGVTPLMLVSRLVVKAPASINISNKDWWTAQGSRLVRLERLLREDLMLIVAATIALLAAIDVQIVVASRLADGASPWWIFWVFLGGYFTVLAVILVRMLAGARYRPYEEDVSSTEENDGG